MLLIRISIFALIITQTLFAQIKISGTIMGSGYPLIGANVYLEGTYDGASTDGQGQFSFTTNEKGDAQLVISYLGFERTLIPLTLAEEDIHLSPKLKPSSSALEAVEITA
ncbi:MAG: carboxypeptidase-like regulatory domain-containing protein, partial [Bacteroidota bacterium]